MDIEDILWVEDAHQNFPKRAENAVRFFDMKTPYYIHPLWCALTIGTETKLDEKTREEGKLVLLYHDILEDTNKGLPNWLPMHIKYSIDEMTFKNAMKQETIEIWKKSKIIRLYKLYDKTSNLMDMVWASPEKRLQYEVYTKKLARDVEENYGELNITKIARSIIKW